MFPSSIPGQNVLFGRRLPIHQPGGTSVAEGDAGSACSEYEVVIRVDALVVPKHVDNRDVNDVRRLEGDHVPPPLFRHGSHRCAAESHRQETVVTRRLPTALQVPENQRTTFLARARLDLLRQTFGDISQAYRLTGLRRADRRRRAFGKRPFSDDDDGEVSSAAIA